MNPFRKSASPKDFLRTKAIEWLILEEVLVLFFPFVLEGAQNEVSGVLGGAGWVSKVVMTNLSRILRGS